MTQHIALAFSELFSVPAQISTYSIIKNNSDLDLKFFFIIEPDFDENEKKSLEQNLNLFKKIFPKFSFQILPVPEDLNNYLTEKYSYFFASHISLFRCFLDELLPKDVDSVLYLDSDIICDGNLDELFKYYEQYQIQYPKNEKIIFACSDIPYPVSQKFLEDNHLDDYFSGAVMLINLKKWRTNQKFKNDLLKEVETTHPIGDQDALNIACHNDLYQNISQIYNYTSWADLLDPKPNPIIWPYHGVEYPLPKRTSTVSWKQIILISKFDILGVYYRLALFFRYLLRPKNDEYKKLQFISSRQVRQKARKTFFKYYDPYLELVK